MLVNHWYPVGKDVDDDNKVNDTMKSSLNAKTAQPMYVVSDKAGSGLKIDVQLADTVLGAGKTYTSITAANAASNAETWTRREGTKDTDGKYTAGSDTFYYNNDVEEGATTAKLVDSVTLDGTVTQYDFIAFDFELNVFMDSIQVNNGSDGKELDNNVQAWDAVKTNDNGEWNRGDQATAATGTRDDGATTEITYINWA